MLTPVKIAKKTKNKADLIQRKADAAKGKIVKPKAKPRGVVLTGPEARKAQEKQSKKHYKNPLNTTSSSRYT